MSITLDLVPTKSAFLAKYRDLLQAEYAWARDEAKLNRFMDSVENTIRSNRNTWNLDGHAVKTAWRAIGGKGSLTYKALRALPDA